MAYDRPGSRKDDPAARLFTPGSLAVGVIAALALRRMGLLGLIGAAAGGAWAYQSWRNQGGKPPTHVIPRTPLTVKRSITIGKPRPEVFAYWRDPTHFPRFMDHVEDVREIGPDAHHWVVRGPLRAHLEWDADLVDIRENEHIGWRARPDADIVNEGSVTFADAPGGRGTEVHLELTYDAPAGKLGAMVAKLMGEEPDRQAHDDLRRLKQILETGHVTSSQPRPHGTR